MTYFDLILQTLEQRSPQPFTQLKRYVQLHQQPYHHPAFIAAIRRGIMRDIIHRTPQGHIKLGGQALRMVTDARTAVHHLREQRQTFHATIGRRGFARGRKNCRTVLLEHVTTPTGDLLCDHAWVHLTKGFQPTQQGDRVSFQARVRAYAKRGGHDFKLFFPTQVTTISAERTASG